MNRPLDKFVLFAFLISFILSPFAGLAPLMLCFLALGTLWFFGSIVRVLFGGGSETSLVQGEPNLAEQVSDPHSH